MFTLIVLLCFALLCFALLCFVFLCLEDLHAVSSRIVHMIAAVRRESSGCGGTTPSHQEPAGGAGSVVPSPKPGH
jgi:hypothetical protein